MEIGYPVFSDTSAPRVWPLYRLQTIEGAANVVYGDNVIVEITCAQPPCHATKILSIDAKPTGLWATANVLRDFSGTSGALLLFEPFPTRADATLVKRSQPAGRSTTLVRAVFRPETDGHLRFMRLEYAGQKAGAPFVWK